jgi:hypothetical protein
MLGMTAVSTHITKVDETFGVCVTQNAQYTVGCVATRGARIVEHLLIAVRTTLANVQRFLDAVVKGGLHGCLVVEKLEYLCVLHVQLPPEQPVCIG